jgi:hypothetical protein
MAKKDSKVSAPEVTSVEPTITVDGEAFAIKDLSPQIQNAIGLLNKWNAEKAEAEQVVIKLQYAVNALSVEIAKAIRPAAEADAPAA